NGVWTVGEEAGALAVCDDQVERVEVRQLRFAKIGITALARQEVSDERPSRGLVRRRHPIAAQVGDHCEAALLGYAEPGSSRLQVSAREQVARLVPSREGQGGTGVELVAVAGDDQRPAGVAAPCEREV